MPEQTYATAKEAIADVMNVYRQDPEDEWYGHVRVRARVCVLCCVLCAVRRGVRGGGRGVHPMWSHSTFMEFMLTC